MVTTIGVNGEDYVMNIGVAVNTCPAGVLFVSTCGFVLHGSVSLETSQ